MRDMMSTEQPACRQATGGNVLVGAEGLRKFWAIPPEATGLAKPVRGVCAPPREARTPLLTSRFSLWRPGPLRESQQDPRATTACGARAPLAGRPPSPGSDRPSPR